MKNPQVKMGESLLLVWLGIPSSLALAHGGEGLVVAIVALCGFLPSFLFYVVCRIFGVKPSHLISVCLLNFPVSWIALFYLDERINAEPALLIFIVIEIIYFWAGYRFVKKL